VCVFVQRAFVVIVGRYRRFHVASSCRQAARRGTVYLLTRWTISWREQIDVRTSHGAGHRMWGWRSTDNDSAAERCSRSTLTLLHWWLCIINQLQWQQFVVELCPHREWEFPFPVFPQKFRGNGGREWEWKTHFRTPLQSTLCCCRLVNWPSQRDAGIFREENKNEHE